MERQRETKSDRQAEIIDTSWILGRFYRNGLVYVVNIYTFAFIKNISNTSCECGVPWLGRVLICRYTVDWVKFLNEPSQTRLCKTCILPLPVHNIILYLFYYYHYSYYTFPIILKNRCWGRKLPTQYVGSSLTQHLLLLLICYIIACNVEVVLLFFKYVCQLTYTAFSVIAFLFNQGKNTSTKKKLTQ